MITILMLTSVFLSTPRVDIDNLGVREFNTFEALDHYLKKELFFEEVLPGKLADHNFTDETQPRLPQATLIAFKVDYVFQIYQKEIETEYNKGAMEDVLFANSMAGAFHVLGTAAMEGNLLDRAHFAWEQNRRIMEGTHKESVAFDYLAQVARKKGNTEQEFAYLREVQTLPLFANAPNSTSVQRDLAMMRRFARHLIEAEQYDEAIETYQHFLAKMETYHYMADGIEIKDLPWLERLPDRGVLLRQTLDTLTRVQNKETQFHDRVLEIHGGWDEARRQAQTVFDTLTQNWFVLREELIDSGDHP